jgi:hypothetical protein
MPDNLFFNSMYRAQLTVEFNNNQALNPNPNREIILISGPRMMLLFDPTFGFYLLSSATISALQENLTETYAERQNLAVLRGFSWRRMLFGRQPRNQ